MGKLATQVLREMNEALVAEAGGATINFVPDGCKFVYMGDTRFNLDLPIFGKDSRKFPNIVIIFSSKNSEYPPIVVDKGVLHHQTKEEEDVLDEVHLWLATGEYFNVPEK